MTKPLTVPRDPKQSQQTLQFMQAVAGMLNPLLLGQTIKQTGPGVWNLSSILAGFGALTDPNADRIPFWDDSAGTGGTIAWLAPVAPIAISTTNLTIAAATYGDIVVTSSGGTGNVWTVGPATITYAKIQNVSAQYHLLGRSSAGAGSVQEIASSSTIFTFLGSADAATARVAIGVGGTGSGSIQVGVYASLPAAGASDRYYQSSDAPYSFIDTGVAWKAFFGTMAVTIPPTFSFYSTSQSTATVNVSKGMAQLTASTDGVFNRYTRAVPAAPYTVTTYWIPTLVAGTEASAVCGLVLQENAGGFVVLYARHRGTEGAFDYILEKYNAASASQGAYVSATILGEMVKWWRIKDDNTNRKIEYSYDGYNWVTFYSVSRTDFITPTLLGIFTWCNGTSSLINLLSWAEA